MPKKEPIEINNVISEAIADLKTSLKQEMEKDFKSQLIISKYLGDTEKNTKALTFCHYKVQGCKRIELDFPDTLITTNQKLSLKLEVIRMELAKRYAIILGNPQSNKENKKVIIVVYKNIKLFLHGVFKQFGVNNIVKEKILDFLVFYLKRQENSIDIYKSNEGLQDFFDFIFLLSEKKFIQDISVYIGKLDALENKEFFLHSNEIQKSFYRLIHEINGLIIYKSLLAKLSLLSQDVFSDDLFLKEFIKTFLNQFTSIGCIEKADFESIFILIYLTLENKARTPAIETRNAWINSLGSMVKKLTESEISSKLAGFKNAYEKKIDNKFKIILEQFKCINTNNELRTFKSEDLNPKIIHWFCLENINRSSTQVKNAFAIAFKKTYYLAFSLPENFQTNKNNLNSSPERQAGVLKKLVVKGKNRLSTALQDKKLNEHTQVNTSHQATLSKLEKDEKLILALGVLQEKLKKIENNLRDFNENMKYFFSTTKIVNFYSSVKVDNLKNSFGDVFSTDLYEERCSRLEIEIETLEKITNDFFRENHPGLFIKKLLDKIRHINDKNSWFENKFFNKQVSSLERVFKRGYFFETHVKLTKLKDRLGRQISFECEKAFFLEENFFTLVRYGIIRWFWVDKETFARNWAEQVVLLKVVAEVNEYEKNENCIADENFNSKAKCFQKLSELAAQIEKKYSKEDFFYNLNKDIKSFEAKIENLLMELKNYSLLVQKKSSFLLNSKVILNFFDNQKKIDPREINYLLSLRPK